MKQDVLDRLLDQNFGKISKSIERFISRYVSQSSARGLVIGLSGGLDSSVVLKLSANALGSDRVLGLILPSSTTPEQDVAHAIDLAKHCRIKYEITDIDTIIERFSQVLPDDKMARGNLMARIRMNILYYHAHVRNSLVAGTGDKSELYIGYYTKYGDGGVDIAPIADLYKTQVRALARFLGVPREIVDKKSSPRLWENHLAEDEIGMDYEIIDPILHLLVDKKMKAKDVASKLGVPAKQVSRVKEMIEKSAHKRALPPTAYVTRR